MRSNHCLLLSVIFAGTGAKRSFILLESGKEQYTVSCRRNLRSGLRVGFGN
jgi:hypothetical protein